MKTRKLPAESRDDVPRVSVTLTDETAWVTRYDPRGQPTTTYPVSAGAVAGAFRGLGGLSTGVLPEGVVFWREAAGQARLGLWLPPARRSLRIARGRRTHELAVWLPGLLLVGQGRRWWLHACRARPSSERDRLYRAPLPNLHDDGLICQGSARFPAARPAAMAQAAAAFFESEFNDDLSLDKVAGHDGPVLPFLRRLRGRFPAGRLVESGLTVADAMGSERARRTRAAEEDELWD